LPATDTPGRQIYLESFYKMYMHYYVQTNRGVVVFVLDDQSGDGIRRMFAKDLKHLKHRDGPANVSFCPVY